MILKSESKKLIMGIKILRDQFIPPIYPTGKRLIGLNLLLAFLTRKLKFIRNTTLALIAFIAFFFRSPKRNLVHAKNQVIAPADGKIVDICNAFPPAELELPKTQLLRISIFLSLLNVHTQRIPLSGTITNVSYRSGKFLTANQKTASEVNERSSIVINTDSTKLIVTQIAGTIARRIETKVQVGQTVTTGDVYGIIKFSSRVDIYLPPTSKLIAQVGQTTIGGETLLAEIN